MKIMNKNIEWKKSNIDYSKLNEISHKTLSSSQNVKKAYEKNKNQGKKNAASGHMKKIQKIGCIIGGIISGNLKSKEQLTKIGKLGNEANIKKYGIPLIAKNILTNEIKKFNSIGEAEKYTNVQSVIITKILRGKQPKTRTGWTFEYKK